MTEVTEPAAEPVTGPVMGPAMGPSTGPAGSPVTGLTRAQEALLERMSAPAGQREGLFPATAAQRSIWFAEQRAPGTSAYHLPALLRLRGPLDTDRLGRALQRLVDTHEALRTSLVGVDGAPLQYVRRAREHRLTIIEAAGRAVPEVVAEAIESAHAPFDLAAGPLLRSTLWRLAADDHLLLVVLHHTMADGWSLGVLLEDLAAALHGAAPGGNGAAAGGDGAAAGGDGAAAGGDGAAPGNGGPGIAAQPVDLALRELAASADEQGAAYWRERLAGAAPPSLPAPETDLAGAACHRLTEPLPAGLSGKLHDVARRLGATDFTVFFAALAAVCHRMTDQYDLVVGATQARRSAAGTERTVGPLVNTAPIRLSWSGPVAFPELVALAGTELRAAMSHGDVPLERIVRDSAGPRQGSRTPLLDVVFSVIADPLPLTRLGGCTVERIPVPPRWAKFPMLVSVELAGGGSRVVCEYDRTLVADELAGSLVRALRNVLTHVADDPAAPVGRLPLLDATELAACLDRARGPVAEDILRGQGFGDVVARIAAEHPDRTALVEGERRLTYRELLSHADGLAAVLRARGAGPDRPVGVALPRGIDQIVSCLAVIRAGGCYLPLDRSSPTARMEYMLSQAGVRLLVTGGEGISVPGVEALTVPLQAGPRDPASTAPPGRPDALALVGFTSGSTGHPKGYAVTQRGLARLIGDRRYLPPSAERVFLIANAVTFDASTWEIWSTLLTGATGVILPEYGYTARTLGAMIREHGVTTVHVTTALFNTVVDEDPYAFLPLSELVIGGEAMSVEHVRRAVRCLPGTRLLNAYGPAECAVMATMQELAALPAAARRVPIGGPLADTQVYVLDRSLQVVPVGVAGEIYIAGTGVGHGYVGRPGLTADRFVPSAFAAGERLYRTGDLARVRADGTLVYLGRVDRQVKIRGYRVEPGDIEACLTRHPAVAEAVVTVSAAGRVVAHVIPNSAAQREDRSLRGPQSQASYTPPSIAQLRDFVRAELPDYMVPSAVVMTDRFPLTANGKIDRAALVDPAAVPDAARRRVAPRTATEQVVLDVWAAVLDRSPDTVSVDDDFFEAGGHSLLATRVVARLEQRLGRPVPLRLLFDRPTVAGLARAIDGAAADGAAANGSAANGSAANGNAGDGHGGPAALRRPDLVPLARQGRPPLSFAQQRLWFLHQMEPESPLYNLALAVRLTGTPDIDALHRALRLVVDRHEALRTVIATDPDGTTHQGVLPSFDVPMVVVAVGGAPAVRRRLADRVVHQAALAPFDLVRDAPIRAHVVLLGEAEQVLAVTVHHIVCDGWSVELLVREVSAAYAAIRAGREPSLPDLPVQYADFAAWQRERMPGEVAQAELAHWERVLAGAPQVLELPADNPRPAVFKYRGGSQPFDLDADQAAGVRQAAAENRVTPFMVLVAGLAVVLRSYTGQDDILIGTPVAGRSHPLVENLIGFFANTLVLRVDLSGDPSAWELIERVHAACLDAFEHQELPFEQLVERLRPQRDLSRTPLFQVMLAVQGEPLTQVRFPGLDVTPYPVVNPSARCDLTVLMRQGPTAVNGVLEYNRDLFEPQTVERMGRHLARALEWLCFSDGSRLSAADLTDERERAWLDAVGWRPPVPGAPPSAVRLLAEHAERRPDAVAVAAGQTQLTYGELMARASGVAAGLRAAAVRRGDVVGVLLPRSPEMAVALLGAWLAGAAFVPLDPGYPVDRLAFMAGDAGVRAVLTRPALAGRLPGTHAVLVDELPAAARVEPVPVGPLDPAYILYTSGSTGRPKGVVVSHGGLVNMLRAAAVEPGLSAADRLVAITTFSFDMGMLELFGPLAAGGTVVVATEEQAHDPHLLAELIDAAGATVVQATPATWRMLTASGWRSPRPLRVWSGGEALPKDLAGELLAAGHDLWNGYGPTETTVYSAVAHITDAADITIGHPVAGTQLRLLDAGLRGVPAGAVGEICIGGAGVAHGYLARPGLTAERFVPGPDGGRLYRTGDLGRWDHRGRLVYLGRGDRQIKLRGMRIEPGEVEARLARHGGVKDCVVVARGDELVAYVVPPAEPGEPPVSTVELRELLRTELPEYMVPSTVVWLDALPLTPNGKVDRAALPEPAYPDQAAPGRLAPRNRLEEAVVEVWATVLNRPAASISVLDDFFDLGGHSLLATRVAGHLTTALGRQVSVRLVFEHPTPAALAKAVSGGAEDGPAALVRVADRERLPLSFAQERLWFLHRLDPTAALYNVPLAVRLTGALRVDLLYQALATVVGEHDALRTVMAEQDGQPYQRVLAPEAARLPMAVVDLRGAGMAARLPQVLRAAGYAPFDLAARIPVRATLARLAASEADARGAADSEADARGAADFEADAGRAAVEEHVLLLTVHHVACDGWSIGLLGRRVSAVYSALCEGREPPPVHLPVQYGDFAVWQRTRLSTAARQAELEHWRGVLAGAPAALDLPTDHPRPAVFRYQGASVPVELDAELTAGLRRLAAEHQVTPFMVLAAALSVVLGRYAGQDEVVLGTPMSARSHPLVEELVGFFANTLVLRVGLSGAATVAELLDRVRETCLDAYGHQDVPFERLVEHLAPRRDLSRTPIFQAMLALQNDPLPVMDLPGVRATPYRVDNPTAKYDLVCTLRDNTDMVSGVLEYNRELFEPETVTAIRDALLSALAAMGTGVARVADLPMCEPAQTRRLLSGWNRAPGYDPDVSLHDLVAQQAARTPDAVAVICDEPDETLTYGRLMARADRVARRLHRRGTGVDELVAVLLPRGADLVVALLGVLRAAAGVLPLDPEHPAGRLAAILGDAGVRTVVTTEALRHLLPPGTGVLNVSDVDSDAGDPPVTVRANPRSLAYAVYTSGSTGTPKGALIEHRAICNNLLWMQQDWPLDGHDRVLQKTTIAFDVAVKEVFWPLLSGAAVVLARPGGQRDPEYLIDLLDRRRITVAHFVPSMLEAALSYAERTGRPFGRYLEKVMAGAETLPAGTLRRFFAATPAELLHMYGPTETAIAVTGWTCPRGHVADRVPLGQPMPGVRLYVLDSRMRPVPRGAWGELYAGGICVGRGYLGRPAETAAAFVPDPWSGEPGARLYRTGDIVRVNHQWLLEFRGRLDHQVKVRGFRVELGDVEAALRRHPAVRQAAVLAWPGPDGTGHRLAGYIAVRASADGMADGATEQEIRDHLRALLPDYMVPATLTVLPELPLNANGKIDRGRLRPPEPVPLGPAPASRSGGGTALERLVATAVGEVLGVTDVGPDDDIFVLGGHSLQVPRIAALLAERTGVEVPLREIFLDPTVAGIARAVERGRAAAVPPITRVDRAAARPARRPGGAP